MKTESQNGKKPKRLQLVLMATGAFAVPSMRALCDSEEFDIICLVTNPMRYDKSGRPIPTPARQFAEEYGIAISEKDDVHSQEFFDFIYLMRPDLLFVCDFGHILKKRVLEGALLGGINLHGSLLPRYRGAAPVHWAILNGEPFTGISIIHMTPQIDAGPVIAQSPPIPIGPFDTLEEVEETLAEFGAGMVLETVRHMACDNPVRIIEQRHDQTTKAPRFKKQDGQIDWNWTARGIFNHSRAMMQWPKSFTDWIRSDGSPLRLILGQVLPLDDLFCPVISDEFVDPAFVPPILVDAKLDNLAAMREHWSDENDPGSVRRKQKRPDRPDWWKPGTVVRADDELIIVAGEGTVQILRIQPAGKKMMDVKDFLQGNPIKPGERLGICVDKK